MIMVIKVVCEHCWNMFTDRCNHCGKVKCRDRTEKNKLDDKND